MPRYPQQVYEQIRSDIEITSLLENPNSSAESVLIAFVHNLVLTGHDPNIVRALGANTRERVLKLRELWEELCREPNPND